MKGFNKISLGDQQAWLSTTGFLDKIDENLQLAMGKDGACKRSVECLIEEVGSRAKAGMTECV